jgi:DNA gyrase subunit A
VTEKTGSVIGVATVKDNDELMLINTEGVIIRMPVADISIQSRITQGVKLIRMDEGVSVVGMAIVAPMALAEDQNERDNERNDGRDSQSNSGRDNESNDNESNSGSDIESNSESNNERNEEEGD